MSLIVLEGLDGSGKGTQTALLFESLRKRTEVRKISFPDYESPSSALVKMYLNGEFSENPEGVNAYAASSFYAVDRYASFQKKWRADYERGVLFLADRYTTSNIVYQLTKLPRSQWEEYIRWAEDFEYEKLRLPRPDLVLFLDMPPEVSQKLLSVRYHGDEAKKDLHERNPGYLAHCRDSALFAASLLGWKVISCAQNGEPRSMEDIHREIETLVTEAAVCWNSTPQPLTINTGHSPS